MNGTVHSSLTGDTSQNTNACSWWDPWREGKEREGGSLLLIAVKEESGSSVSPEEWGDDAGLLKR